MTRRAKTASINCLKSMYKFYCFLNLFTLDRFCPVEVESQPMLHKTSLRLVGDNYFVSRAPSKAAGRIIVEWRYGPRAPYFLAELRYRPKACIGGYDDLGHVRASSSVTVAE